MDKKTTKLSNNIDFIYKRNENTPRTALCLNFAIAEPEKKAGIYQIISQLLLQGTKKYSAEALAQELDKYAIELSIDSKLDYMRFKILSLNEDFDKALELLEDIIKNSTFDEFDKEIAKAKGWITAKLDSPRAKAVDTYYKNMFVNHPYGTTASIILENLDKLTKQDIIDTYKDLISNSKKVCALVGDLDFETVKEKLETHLNGLTSSDNAISHQSRPQLTEAKTIDDTKPNLSQAQILKGWITDSYSSQDYPALVLLNGILGGGGLSSRLFLELREKKGLAYVVRSSVDTYINCGTFFIYIATEPKNIQVALKGFEEEIEKIKNTIISKEELENGKNNFFGKLAFLLETNSQQAATLAHYAINNLGFKFDDELIEKIKNVTPQDIQNCAKKYFNDISITSILRP